MALKRTRALAVGVAGAVGGIAFYRWLTRPQPVLQESLAVTEPPALVEEPDPRAEALRAKLEDPEPADEPTTAERSSAEPSPDERRREVHAAAETTVRKMRRSSGS